MGKQFVDLMDSNKAEIRQPTVRIIGNILTGSDEKTEKVLQLKILDKYKRLLCDDISPPTNNKEKREICWSLSNITAGPLKDRLKVLECGLFPVLIQYLEAGPYDIQKEALWAISNATPEANKQIICPLVDLGVIKALCAFLRKTNKDKTLMVCLECIENILIVGNQHLCHGEVNRFANHFEENGGLQSLEDLQADDENVSDCIYEKCVEIITKYLGGEEEEQQNNNIDDDINYGDFGTINNHNNNNNDNNNFNGFNF